eukprot:TRINITY_DN257_c0_g2_i1.p1 TRINITY_DN257_c0_g2~~TRINITY_DN257_c0_g2_i1.p1  ORF type:complete len:372 (+),score=77.82 TRINITY_DN257_c0_g2_i1:159-1274(+)
MSLPPGHHLSLVVFLYACIVTMHCVTGITPSSIPRVRIHSAHRPAATDTQQRVGVPPTSASPTRASTRPIVGVLTQPTSGELAKYGDQYIAASYVKYAEAGGARVVPILYDTPLEDLQAQLQNLNGVLFPGGGADLQGTTLYKAGQAIFDFAKQSYDNKSNPFPIFGHCMGFELLNMIISQDYGILSHCDAEDYTLPLDNMDLSSNIFGKAPSTVQGFLADATLNITMNNHQQCVTTDTYGQNSKLQAFYKVVSTNTDRQGLEFVSTFEANNYPIWGYQWHPEKNQFEWNVAEVIQHTPEAIEAMSYLQRFFIDQARASQNSFPDPKSESEALIYNYNPLYTESFDASFEQCYVFKSTEAHAHRKKVYSTN